MLANGCGFTAIYEAFAQSRPPRQNLMRGTPPLVFLCCTPDAWRRLLGYLIQSFAAEAAQPLPDPPTKTQMYRALLSRKQQ